MNGNSKMTDKFGALKSLLADLMAKLPQDEGSIREPTPIRRIARDGVVLEIDCDLLEEEQIIAETQPVDFARRDTGTSVVFVWLAKADEQLRQIYRDHRHDPPRL